MQGHTAAVGGAFMTIGSAAAGILATVASTSQATAGDWHQAWFLALISLCGSIAVSGVYIVCAGAITALPPRHWTPQTDVAHAATFPDVEFDTTGLGFRATETEPSSGAPFPGRIVHLRTRMTNHETERRASLSFRYLLRVKPNAMGGIGITEMPLSPITEMPLDLAPQQSLPKTVEFNRGLMPRDDELDETPPSIEVEDHLSGTRTAIPHMGRWRPARDGEWLGAFPPAPDLRVAVDASLDQEELDRGHVIVESNVLVTNTEAEKDMSLEFRLRILNDVGATVFRAYPDNYGVHWVGRMKNESVSLRFNLLPSVVSHALDVEKHQWFPKEQLRLSIYDRVSGKQLDLPLPVQHRPEPENAR